MLYYNLMFNWLMLLSYAFNAEHADEKPTIIYVFDPMCGWCYGFSPVIAEVAIEYSDRYNFDILCGGMVIGDREGPIGNMSDYILSAIPRLEEYTGVKIGEPYIEILNDGTYFSSSEMPSIAIQVFKHLSDENAVSFAEEVQKAMFLNGKSLNDINTYLELIKPYDISSGEFVKCMNDPDFKRKTFAEFDYADQLGVTGYPTILLKQNGNYKVLARGFVPLERLVSVLNNQ